MSKIRVLPEVLANKIAAGEIIERPASVVKELLENSIDAGSESVQVTIQSGGKRLIAVCDDGEGMSQDDAILAFEHHATSKIKTAEDLAAISTLGFRGEALPSIASISRLLMRTRPAGATAESGGTELEIQGGVLRNVKATAWDRGTEVTVRDLFFNVPARRKFLRSHETELGHITRLVTHYALAHPEMRFKLDSDGRSLLDLAPVQNLRERVFQIFGGDFFKNLLDLQGQNANIALRGFCSVPHEQRTNPYSQFFYVNRRVVRDRVLSSAVRQAYLNCIPASAYPIVFIFLEIPFDQVDVNAHPAKTEIRFRQQGLVHDLVRESIRTALSAGSMIPPFQHRAAEWSQSQVIPAGVPLAFSGASESSNPEMKLHAPQPDQDPIQAAFNYSFQAPAANLQPLPENHAALGIRPDFLFDPSSEATRPFQCGQVRILGQIHESYIVVEDSEGLLIIDQHVAHERILYEKISRNMSRTDPEIQRLLVPLSIELQPHQSAILRKVMPELASNGLEVEPFGGNAALVRSVPAMAADCDVKIVIAEILDGLEKEERTLDLERIRNRIAVSMACRAAIKIHTPLSLEKMQWLLQELSSTQIPTNCPHGRPIILRFSLYEIERNFGRI